MKKKDNINLLSKKWILALSAAFALGATNVIYQQMPISAATQENESQVNALTTKINHIRKTMFKAKQTVKKTKKAFKHAKADRKYSILSVITSKRRYQEALKKYRTILKLYKSLLSERYHIDLSNDHYITSTNNGNNNSTSSSDNASVTNNSDSLNNNQSTTISHSEPSNDGNHVAISNGGEQSNHDNTSTSSNQNLSNHHEPSTNSSANSSSHSNSSTALSTATNEDNLAANHVTIDQLNAVRAQILSDVNRDRASVGAAPLITNDKLNQLAQIRAAQLIDNFSHYNAQGQRYSTLDAPSVGLPAKFENEENIAMNEEPNVIEAAKMANTQWWTDEAGATPSQDGGHRKNIRDTGNNYIGIGVAYNPANNQWFFVHEFGSDNLESSQSLNPNGYFYK